MSPALSDALFAVAAFAIAVAQFLILRSTRRGMATGPRRGGAAREWAYAVLPAVALVAVLAWTWRTMHPAVERADARTAASRSAT